MFIHYNNEICCSKPQLFDLSGAKFNCENGCKRYRCKSFLLTVLFKKPHTEVWLYRSTYFWTHFSQEPFYYFDVFLQDCSEHVSSSLHTSEYISILSSSSKQITLLGNDIICQSNLSTQCSQNCREAFWPGFYDSLSALYTNQKVW